MLLVADGSVKTPPLEMFKAGLDEALSWLTQLILCSLATQSPFSMGELQTLGL